MQVIMHNYQTKGRLDMFLVMVINGLEDWCEQMLECCKAKSIHEHEPIMASIANDEDCGDFIDDKSFKGAWCKYELTDSNLVGDAK